MVFNRFKERFKFKEKKVIQFNRPGFEAFDLIPTKMMFS
jgi:hypothetical protein